MAGNDLFLEIGRRLSGFRQHMIEAFQSLRVLIEADEGLQVVEDQPFGLRLVFYGVPVYFRARHNLDSAWIEWGSWNSDDNVNVRYTPLGDRWTVSRDGTIAGSWSSTDMTWPLAYAMESILSEESRKRRADKGYELPF